MPETLKVNVTPEQMLTLALLENASEHLQLCANQLKYVKQDEASQMTMRAKGLLLAYIEETVKKWHSGLVIATPAQLAANGVKLDGK